MKLIKLLMYLFMYFRMLLMLVFKPFLHYIDNIHLQLSDDTAMNHIDGFSDKSQINSYPLLPNLNISIVELYRLNIKPIIISQ